MERYIKKKKLKIKLLNSFHYGDGYWQIKIINKGTVAPEGKISCETLKLF